MHTSGQTLVCSSVPRIEDLSVLGQSCKAVLVATEAVRRLPIPPARLQMLRTIAFLDRRLMLRDITWVVAEQGLLDLDLLVESQRDGIPPGYCINVKGAQSEIRVGRTFLRIPNGTVLTLTLVEEDPSSSELGMDDSSSSDDSDTSDKGGQHRQSEGNEGGSYTPPRPFGTTSAQS